MNAELKMPKQPQRRSTTTAATIAAAIVAGALLPAPGGAQSASDAVTVVGTLMWAAATNGEDVSWPDASEYCETLELDAFDDWRLPTLVEVESLYDPASETRLVDGFALDQCCVWSATNLVALEAEAKGVLPDVTNDPKDYYWGFLFPSGVRYYSFGRFPDGQALCVRAAD